MIILLLKAFQPGLFDKVVQIAPTVTKDGTVRTAHTAIRHVRPEAPKAHEPAHVGDLFDEPRPAAAKPAPKPKVAPAPEPDLFDAPPKAADKPADIPTPAPAPKTKPPKAEPVDTAPDIPAVVAVAKVDYSVPFDPDKVPHFGVPAGTSKDTRRKLNASAAALAVLPPIHLSDADRDLLRQYSGNGGCGDSLNEFYTEPTVAAAMWKVLKDLGMPDEALALEPSCATGVFLETAPAGCKVVGVEMDGTSARIGELLHPGHEVVNSSLERFATTDTRQFDVVIGNAPFGGRGSLIKDDKPDMKTAEAYFMDTALDKLKPGGVVAMIVPTGIMNGKNSRKVRERLLRKGQFLGALRMPNSAFEAAHTDVTSDILFFRKRDQDVAGALGAVDQGTLKKLGVWDEEYLGGAYFEDRGAANVLGTVGTAMRSFGEIYAVTGSMDGVPDAIATFKPENPGENPLSVQDILEATPDEAMREKARAASVRAPYDVSKRGDTRMVDGVQYILEGEPLRWHRVDEFMQDQAVTQGQLLAADIDRVMNGDTVPDLEERLKAYVAAHGIPAKNPNLQIAARTDKQLYRLLGAVGLDGSVSDAVAGRAAAPVESSFDAAAQSLALETGWFTPEAVAGRWSAGDTETVIDHLYASPEYALDPVSGLWTSTDQYLSGEMWPKFDEAKAALERDDLKPEDRGKLERQVQALEEAIDPKLLEDVEVQVNSAFVPLHVIAAYFNEKKAASAKEGNAYLANLPDMSISFDRGVYAIRGGGHDTGLLEKYLNRTGVKKDDLNELAVMNAAFKEWLCGSTYRDEVETLYNRNFRGFRQRAYSETPFEIPGMNTDGIKPHIYSGIRQALESGKGILADDVGLGKTVQGLILARMAKVTGGAKKPMITVPKSVLVNWVGEAEKWFPGCTILTIGETITKGKDGKYKSKQDSAAERNRKLHDLTQNDYDFVLISQPAFNDLDLDPIIKGEYADKDFWVQRGDSLGNAGDKRINKVREAHKQALATRDFQKRTDAIYFNDLGVDMLIGDEMHAYKNLYAAKNRFGSTPKFLGGQGLSNRALDMKFKTDWLREQNDGKGVYGLTATPTKNSPLEIYSMLAHIAPEAFEKIGIRNSEEFIDRFCEFRMENVLTTGGAIEEAMVTVGFKNLDELREIMRRYINRRTAGDVGLKLPARDDRMHLIDMSAEQQAVYAELREAAERAAGARDATGENHIFSIMDRMGKAAMDLALLDPKYGASVSPKIEAAADQIAAGAKDGGQVIFCDSVHVHEKIAAALVKRGIPRDRIAIVNGQTATTASARQNISDSFNAGELDAVIGNTATMGEGMNLQKRTTDHHDLDMPWDPSSLQQRRGRGLRQGNTMESVRMHTYLAKGSFDGYRYQTIAAKKDWMDLLWNGGDRVENLAREGAISRDDMMIMLSADPDAARAKLEENKAAAQAKFDAAKHGDAAKDFARYQEMRRSYGALKKKETAGGERLRVKLARAKLSLEENPYFKAKHLLESNKAAVIQPATGQHFENGLAFELPRDAGVVHGGGKFVVTSVAPGEGLVGVRRYGQLSGRDMAIKLDDLEHGVTTFDYDQKAEQKEMAEHMAAAAASNTSSISSYKDMHAMPSALLEANYATIQTQVKAGMKAYTFRGDNYGGKVPLVTSDGKPVLTDTWSAKAAMDTHDVMLPTDKHRELAIGAYMDAERGKTFRRTYDRGSSRIEAKYGYEGYNPWNGALDTVFGAGTALEAQKRFEGEQSDLARRAPDTAEAIEHVARTVSPGYGTPKWPRKGLATLWGRLRHDGVLDAPIATLLKPGGVGSRELFDTGGMQRGNVANSPAGEALIEMAKQAGHHDLAAAMIVQHAKAPDSAVAGLLGLPLHTPKLGGALRHLVDLHPDLARKPLGTFQPADQVDMSNRMGHAWRMASVGDLADRLEDAPGETGGDTRVAA